VTASDPTVPDPTARDPRTFGIVPSATPPSATSDPQAKAGSHRTLGASLNDPTPGAPPPRQPEAGSTPVTPTAEPRPDPSRTPSSSSHGSEGPLGKSTLRSGQPGAGSERTTERCPEDSREANTVPPAPAARPGPVLAGAGVASAVPSGLPPPEEGCADRPVTTPAPESPGATLTSRRSGDPSPRSVPVTARAHATPSPSSSAHPSGSLPPVEKSPIRSTTVGATPAKVSRETPPEDVPPWTLRSNATRLPRASVTSAPSHATSPWRGLLPATANDPFDGNVATGSDSRLSAPCGNEGQPTPSPALPSIESGQPSPVTALSFASPRRRTTHSVAGCPRVHPRPICRLPA
jgi:hypothetical protein